MKNRRVFGIFDLIIIIMLKCEHSLYRVFGFVTSQRLQSSPETKSKAPPTKAECQLANSSYHNFIETFFFFKNVYRYI